MRNIDDPRARSDSQNHALHRAHEMIRDAEIGGESNH